MVSWWLTTVAWQARIVSTSCGQQVSGSRPWDTPPCSMPQTPAAPFPRHTCTCVHLPAPVRPTLTTPASPGMSTPPWRCARCCSGVPPLTLHPQHQRLPHPVVPTPAAGLLQRALRTATQGDRPCWCAGRLAARCPNPGTCCPGCCMGTRVQADTQGPAGTPPARMHLWLLSWAGAHACRLTFCAFLCPQTAATPPPPHLELPPHARLLHGFPHGRLVQGLIALPAALGEHMASSETCMTKRYATQRPRCAVCSRSALPE